MMKWKKVTERKLKILFLLLLSHSVYKLKTWPFFCSVKNQLKFLLLWHITRWHGEMSNRQKFITKTFSQLATYGCVFLCWMAFCRTISDWNGADKKVCHVNGTQSVRFVYIRLSLCLQVIAYSKTQLFMNTVAIIYCYCNYLNADTALFIQAANRRNVQHT